MGRGQWQWQRCAPCKGTNDPWHQPAVAMLEFGQEVPKLLMVQRKPEVEFLSVWNLPILNIAQLLKNTTAVRSRTIGHKQPTSANPSSQPVLRGKEALAGGSDKSPLIKSRKENRSFGVFPSRVWTPFSDAFPNFHPKKKLINIYGRDIFYNIHKLFTCAFSLGLSF